MLHSLQYLPDAVGIGVYSGGLAEELAARGHAVEVVAAKPFYPQWKLRKGEPSGTYTRTENGVKVTRVPVYVPAEPSGARRIAHYLSFAATSRKPLKQADRPDLVISVAPALLAARVAGRVARQAGIPFWLHIQDLEVDAAMATGLLPHEGQVASAAFAVERRILEMPDVVSSISPRMLEKLAAKGVPAERLFELRNWSQSLDLFAHADGGRYRTEWNLGNRKVALYSGNIARKQGLELVIDAARRLQSRDDIVFVICGEGPNRARLEEHASDLGKYPVSLAAAGGTPWRPADHRRHPSASPDCGRSRSRSAFKTDQHAGFGPPCCRHGGAGHEPCHGSRGLRHRHTAGRRYGIRKSHRRAR
ncbi:hypothetical protein GCM10010989_08610 [Croceicoccus pelagius]|uniref:Colanic acid biosynthesis glycosyl transferase WcaI n=1 Tax=Croceicoccus pelagius TaxID=1703341 RepID=A0A917DFU6_9SPHN|nr:hypothetical protein GCM10010989_08610 [Croceicoccus pelagius]